jgi:hypothetical protein
MKAMEGGGAKSTFLTATSCHIVVWLAVERHGDDLLFGTRCKNASKPI